VTVLMNAPIPLIGFFPYCLSEMLQAVPESSEVIMQTVLEYFVLFFYNMSTKYDLLAPNRTTIYAGVFNPTNCVCYHK